MEPCEGESLVVTVFEIEQSEVFYFFIKIKKIVIEVLYFHSLNYFDIWIMEKQICDYICYINEA